MALFRALHGIAPHLDAAMVLNVCEGTGLLVSVRGSDGGALHHSEELLARVGLTEDTMGALRYFDEAGRELTPAELPHEQVRRSGEDVLNVVSRIEGPGGSIWVQVSYTALAPGVDGYSVLGIGSDISARRDAAAVLHRLATHDGLTGLLNRVGLLAGAEACFDRAVVGGTEFAIAMLDIDRFKAVNDRFGHAAGDAVLAAVAATLRHSVAPAAILGRWGGEEFLVVLPDRGRAAALAAADRLRQAVAATIVSLDEIDGLPRLPAGVGHELRVTASLGIAALPGPAATLDALIAQADEALYAAKRAGRDRVAA